MGLSSWLKDVVVSNVSEIVFLLFKIGESMLEPSVRLYLYEGVCMSVIGSANSTQQCTSNALAYQSEQLQTHVQDEASRYLVAYKVLMNAPALLLGFFCGSWSDTIGRRIPILLALVLTAAAVLMYSVSIYINSEGGVMLILLGALMRGGVGRSAVITMALYSLVCDQTSEENRTKKIGRLLSMSYFGYFLGSLTAAGLLDAYGFDVIFVVVLCVDLLCILVVMLFMKKDGQKSGRGDGGGQVENGGKERKDDGVIEETAGGNGGKRMDDKKQGDKMKPSWDDKKNDGEMNGRLNDSVDELKDGKMWSKKWMNRMMPFKFSHVINSVQVLTSKRPQNTHLHMLIFFFILFANQTCRSGESDVTLLITEAQPFSWKKSMYAYLMASDYALLGVCVLVLLPIFIRFFGFSDCGLIMLGLIFRIIKLVILAFSSSTYQIFFSTILGSPSALIVSCCKASISKVVNDNERGKVFALVSCAETVAILTGSVIFVSVYNSTKDYFHGSVFLLEALFFLAMLLIVYFVEKNAKKDYMEMASRPLENVNNSNATSLDVEGGNVVIQEQGGSREENVAKVKIFQDSNTSLIKKPNKNPFYDPDYED